MKNVIFIFFILSIHFLSAQKKKDIKENVTDFYSKNDSLPFFKFEKAELDTFIQIVFNYPMNARLMKLKFNDKIGFKVDKNGLINSFTHYNAHLVIPKNIAFTNEGDEQKMYTALKKESEKTIKLTESLWFSDSTRANKEIVINIQMLPGNIQNEDMTVVYYDPGSSGVNSYQLGVRKFAIKKTLLAKAYFEDTINRDRNSVDAYYNLAACWVKLKDNNKACENFKKCLELGDKTVEEQIKTYCK